MAEQTFKSPGFFEREIDVSQRGASKSFNVPGGIIGISESGPAFVPTTVTSIQEFENVFGNIRPEHFGAIAANEFLKRRPAITFVRTLGAGVIQQSGDLNNFKNYGTVSGAGFSLSGSEASAAQQAGAADKRHQGCVQFIAAKHEINENESHLYPFVSQNQSVGTSTSYFIRGMVFLASGAKMEILDHDSGYNLTGSATDEARISSYTGPIKKQGIFKIVISSSLGSTFSNDESEAGIKIYTASLNPDSDYYINKVLNTNYQKFDDRQHLLYSDFVIENDLAKVEYSAGTPTVAVLSGTAGSSTSGDTTKHYRELFGSFNTRYANAKTTKFISQPFGNKEHDLFHFETLSDGEKSNKLFSISIANLKKSTSNKNPYGTFTVQVRKYNDNDDQPVIYEQFNNCNLNPNSEDFVGSLIGDAKKYYNFNTVLESERSLLTAGTYPNKSKYIRIVINQSVLDKKIPADCLPFGFKGLPLIKTSNTLTSTATPIPGGENTIRLSASGSQSANFEYSILPPVPLTYKVTQGNGNVNPNFAGHASQDENVNPSIYWGIQSGRLRKNKNYDENGTSNPLLQTNNRIQNESSLIDGYSKFLGIQKLDALLSGSGADAFNNNKFTLARVALNNQSASTDSLLGAISRELTGSADDHMVSAAYIRSASLDLPNMTINDGVANPRRLTLASLLSGDANTFNKFSKYAKFTNIFFGGFDGLNILDKDSRLMNDKASSLEVGGKAAGGVISYQNLHAGASPGVGTRNNIVSSYLEAANILTLEGLTNINILIVPGIKEPLVTNKISDKVRDNSKILYLMDIPAYDKNSNRLFEDSTVKINVNKTVDKFAGRSIDNSYVASYFPDTYINTDAVGKITKVPASVSAFQALGYNDSVSFPWFAPAGFNRGALSNVVNTVCKLNTADRDNLYEARINPIAQFATGKIVIFGQKTLQMDKSALDRVNVRRMVLEVKRIVSRIAGDFVFEQNTQILKNRFISQVTPKLALVQSEKGIDRFQVIMDKTNNTTLDEENNRLNGTIVLVPTRAIEFIAIDFIITNSGVIF